MARWTPVIIQGGKADPAVTEADLSQAFAYAGLISDDGLFDYKAIFEALDANKSAADADANQMPCCEIFTDEFGEQHLRFF